MILAELPDSEFMERWQRLSIEERSEYGADGFARYSKLRGPMGQYLPKFAPLPAKPATAPRVASLAMAEFLASFDPGVDVVEGILKRGNLYALTAKTGHAKTTVKGLLETCVCMGFPFAGHDVEICNVLSIVLENPDNQKPQYIAYQQWFKVTLDGISVIDRAPSLAMALEDIRLDAALNGPFGLVTVDTSAAAFGGTDENDNVQARQHAADLRELTNLPGRPAVVVLTHPTKAAGSDNLLPRGGGAFLNEIDGNLTLWREGDRVTLSWAGKFRGQEFEPIQFRLQEHLLAGHFDAKGKQISTVIALPIDDREAERLARADWNDENRVLHAMLHNPSGSLADWARDSGWVSEAGLPNKAKVHRLLDSMLVDKLVKKERKRSVLTDAGKREAERDKF